MRWYLVMKELTHFITEGCLQSVPWLRFTLCQGLSQEHVEQLGPGSER